MEERGDKVRERERERKRKQRVAFQVESARQAICQQERGDDGERKEGIEGEKRGRDGVEEA